VLGGSQEKDVVYSTVYSITVACK